MSKKGEWEILEKRSLLKKFLKNLKNGLGTKIKKKKKKIIKIMKNLINMINKKKECSIMYACSMQHPGTACNDATMQQQHACSIRLQQNQWRAWMQIAASGCLQLRNAALFRNSMFRILQQKQQSLLRERSLRSKNFFLLFNAFF